jgi:hypothetical protein
MASFCAVKQPGLDVGKTARAPFTRHYNVGRDARTQILKRMFTHKMTLPTITRQAAVGVQTIRPGRRSLPQNAMPVVAV